MAAQVSVGPENDQPQDFSPLDYEYEGNMAQKKEADNDLLNAVGQ